MHADAEDRAETRAERRAGLLLSASRSEQRLESGETGMPRSEQRGESCCELQPSSSGKTSDQANGTSMRTCCVGGLESGAGSEASSTSSNAASQLRVSSSCCCSRQKRSQSSLLIPSGHEAYRSKSAVSGELLAVRT
jgi:hypothetical protein